MSQNDPGTQISFSPRHCCQILAIAVIGLTLMGSAIQYLKYFFGYDYLLGLFPLFNLNTETSIPTWFSSATLALCAVLLGLISFAKKKANAPFASHWAVLALVFLYMSIDEGAHIHETVETTLELRVTGITHGFLRHGWVIYGSVLVLAVAAYFRKFLIHLPLKTLSLFILAGVTYVTGAIGMEMIGARYVEQNGSQNFSYQMMTVTEESMEMIGVLVFTYALLSYMSSYVSGFVVTVTAEKPIEQTSGAFERPTKVVLPEA